MSTTTTVTAADVNKLRQMTGAGMMDSSIASFAMRARVPILRRCCARSEFASMRSSLACFARVPRCCSTSMRRSFRCWRSRLASPTPCNRRAARCRCRCGSPHCAPCSECGARGSRSFVCAAERGCRACARGSAFGPGADEAMRDVGAELRRRELLEFPAVQVAVVRLHVLVEVAQVALHAAVARVVDRVDGPYDRA